MPRICLYCARYSFEPLQPTPLGNGYIAAYLIQQKIVNEDDILIAEDLDEIIAFKPDILGVGSVSQVINDAIRCAVECKKRFDCLTVLGGYHITGLPEKLPDAFDVGVLGEGELTFAEIIRRYIDDGLNSDEFSRIKGVCYHDNGRVVVGERRNVITDLNTLPFPLRPKGYMKEVPLFTSRGCPYRCIYCASHSFWHNKYRLRSADSVVAEISLLVDRYHPELISIQDDLWMANKKRFREIVQRLIELGIPEKVSFSGMCRSNLVGEEEILLFKQMNYKFVRFGGETGSDFLLKRIKGQSVSIDDHQRVIDLSKKHGLPCSASFMAGVPGETIKDLEETVTFLRKNKGLLTINGFYCFNPVPGTELWEALKEENVISDDFPFEKLRFNFLKENFSWDNMMYFNEKNVPLYQFKNIVERIKSEFVYKKPSKIKVLFNFIRKILGERTYGRIVKMYRRIVLLLLQRN